MAGRLSQSSASSGVFFQGDSQSQNVLSSSFGNSANSISGTGHLNLGLDSRDVVLNSVANSGPSSLVTDANSAFLGGSQFQRSASFNTESYLRLPASPMSFTSNNITVSGSSVIDDPNRQQGGSSQTGQYPLNMGQRIPNSFIQDPMNLSHPQKKARLDIKQEDILQLLQRQDPMQLQRLRQQQILQSMSPMQIAQLQQQHLQQQQQQLRNQLQQQSMQQMAAMKNPYDTGGVCARRLMQYLYHQRQRPAENTIAYWRKFVTEYYAPRSKKRWCLSLYENVGQHALGVFPQASMDAWHCDLCGSKSGRGFEATFEVLPRLNEIKYASGVIDELLFVDLPRERRFANGIMMLEYGKAVQESVYEQLRVVREGQLRIIFSQELKILSWDFCARRHEELLPRRLVAPQVNQLLEVAQKCQSTQSDCGSEGVSSQDLQTNSNMIVTAGRQLAKSLELQSLNDLGFSKRYVRCLQIAEVVNSMKDLVDFCRDNKLGPIEGLKSYPRHNPTPRMPIQRMSEMEQLAGIQGPPTDRKTVNNPLASHSGMSNHNFGNSHIMPANNLAALNGPLALTNYQNMMRQNSFNSSPHQVACNSSIQSKSSFHGISGLFPGPGSMQNSLSNNGSSQGQSLQQLMMQQLLQDVAVNNAGGVQKTSNGQNVNPNLISGGLGYGNNGAPTTPSASSNVPGNGGPTLCKSNSFKAPSNSDSSAVVGGSSRFNQKTPDVHQNLCLTDDMVPDLPHDFAESGFFSSDLDDNLGFGWKD
ncbi:hypothetical protein RND81_05G082600 [Saponaria officinalis]|uniref:Transcriptional regulator SLK2 n=1 Tax=Saponaria officinalis TaxID=3572 RepID=A0AAW1KRH9_SAPOF